MSPSAVGVIINPVAGIGGRVALHGSDGPAGIQAGELGGSSAAHQRMVHALRVLGDALPKVRLVTASGQMGTMAAHEAGLASVEVYLSGEPSSADDTRAAAAAMCEDGVGLILFAGGDGTARDLFAAVGDTVAVLGVPAGVKMHSAVFAVNPRAAGSAAASFLDDSTPSPTVSAEIADLTDPLNGDTPGSVAIFGIAQVPRQPSRIQSMKSAPAQVADLELAALGREVAAEMLPDRLYLLGPGTTVAHVKAALGIQGSVLGFDAVRGGELLGRDATEQQLWDLICRHPQATLVLGVIGGQGFLLGRGNQQISQRVLAAIGEENVEILAAQEKLSLLDPPVLQVDLDQPSGEDEPGTVVKHEILTGYRRVRTRPRHSTVLKVVS